MFVKLWMTSNVLTVASTQPIAEVEQIMRDNRIRRVPVVNDGKLVGIISREDMFRAEGDFCGDSSPPGRRLQ